MTIRELLQYWEQNAWQWKRLNTWFKPFLDRHSYIERELTRGICPGGITVQHLQRGEHVYLELLNMRQLRHTTGKVSPAHLWDGILAQMLMPWGNQTDVIRAFAVQGPNLFVRMLDEYVHTREEIAAKWSEHFL